MAAGPTFEPIATATPSGVTTYTFSSITNAYTDLVLVGSVIMSASTVIRLRFNGSSGTYYTKYYLSDGTVSQNSSASMMELVNNDGSVFSNFYVDILDYKGTTYPTKTALCRSADQTNSWLNGGAWVSSNAINSIEIYTTNSATFSSPSRLTLYGIARA